MHLPRGVLWYGGYKPGYFARSFDKNNNICANIALTGKYANVQYVYFLVITVANCKLVQFLSVVVK